MGAEPAMETTGKVRPRRRRARLAGVIGALALVVTVASACNGPTKAQKTTLALSCVRSDVNGTRIMTYSTNVTVGVSMPTFVRNGGTATITDATLAGVVSDDDWVVLRVSLVSGSPSSLQFLRSPGDNRFNNTHSVKVNGPVKTNLSARLTGLFVVHPKGGSYVYDDCKPTAARPTFAYAPIR